MALEGATVGWFALLAVGAAISAVAEFGHLHWFWTDKTETKYYVFAILAAIGVAAVEYVCTVTSERKLFLEQKVASVPVLYLFFNFIQLAANAALVYWIMGMKPNGFHIAAYVLMLGVLGLGFAGDFYRTHAST